MRLKSSKPGIRWKHWEIYLFPQSLETCITSKEHPAQCGGFPPFLLFPVSILTPLRHASHFQKTGIRLETLRKVRIPNHL